MLFPGQDVVIVDNRGAGWEPAHMLLFNTNTCCVTVAQMIEETVWKLVPQVVCLCRRK